MGKKISNVLLLYFSICMAIVILLIVMVSMIFTFGRGNSKYEANKSSEDLFSAINHSIFTRLADVTKTIAQDVTTTISENANEFDAHEKIVIKLNMLQKALGLDMCYILDDQGTVIASSVNAKIETLDMHGRNYAFRPYFTEAMLGKDVIYPALGSATFERGVYFSSPIWDSQNNIIGVAVSKMGMHIFDNILKESVSISAVTTAKGIIISSNREDWLFRSIYPLSSEEYNDIISSKQFLNTPIQQLDLQIDDETAHFHNKKYIISKRSIGNTDWVLLYLYEPSITPILSQDQWGLITALFAYFIVLIIVVAFMAHINIRRRAAEMMHQKLYHAVQHSSSVIVITDIHGTVEYVNPAFTQETGYSLEECVDKNIHFLNAGQQNRDFYEDMWKTIMTGEDWKGTFCNKRKNGEVYWDDTLVSSVKDIKGRITNFIAIKEDVTKQREMDELLLKYATTDEMTGTLNRRSGMLMIERQIQIANKSNQSFVILFMDINGLKTVNDTLGHDYGDELIKTAVGVLKESLRDSDAICRLGGDEFLVILTTVGASEADAVLQRVMDKIEMINCTMQHVFLISLSFGMAEYVPGKNQTVDDLIREADENMYKNKSEIKRKQGMDGVLRVLKNY